jgi:hypothetical protein
MARAAGDKIKLRMDGIPKIAGGLDAYEFYVEMWLHFHCMDCGTKMDCPVLDSDTEAPQPPWATREGKRGMEAGWYVPPLLPDGSLNPISFCPNCSRKRGLEIPNAKL